jgi:hypothetical protein
MNTSVTQTVRRYVAARLESDEATPLEWWLAHPRIQLGHAVSDLGQRVMSLGHRICDAAPNGDEHEAFELGMRIGRRQGRREPSRAEVVALLDGLGLDSSDATMGKLGYGPQATSCA